MPANNCHCREVTLVVQVIVGDVVSSPTVLRPCFYPLRVGPLPLLSSYFLIPSLFYPLRPTRTSSHLACMTEYLSSPFLGHHSHDLRHRRSEILLRAGCRRLAPHGGVQQGQGSGRFSFAPFLLLESTISVDSR